MSAKGAVAVAAMSLLTAACAQADPCTVLMQKVELVRTGAVASVASDRVSFGPGARRPGRVRVRIVQRGDFFPPVGLQTMHRCLGAEWHGRVEDSLRDGWIAPAVVFERNGWPDVILLDDNQKLEIIIGQQT